MESKTKRMTAMAMLVAMAYIMAMIGRVPVCKLDNQHCR